MNHLIYLTPLSLLTSFFFQLFFFFFCILHSFIIYPSLFCYFISELEGIWLLTNHVFHLCKSFTFYDDLFHTMPSSSMHVIAGRSKGQVILSGRMIRGQWKHSPSIQVMI